MRLSRAAAVLLVGLVLWALWGTRVDPLPPVEPERASSTEDGQGWLPIESAREPLLPDAGASTLPDGAPSPVALEAGPAVRVIDLSGEPVAGAAILLKSGAEDSRVGITDTEGRLALPAEQTCNSIVVVHPAFSRYIGFGGVLKDRGLIEIVLEPGASISGVVTRKDSGESVGTGVVVFAMPTMNPFLDPLDIALAGTHSEGVPQSSTNEWGRFSITGLRPGMDYTLIAAGNGLFSGWEHKGSPSGTTGTRVQVTGLFALYVTFETPSGRLRSVSGWAGRSSGTRFISVLPEPGVEFVVVDDSIARLAGARLTDAVEDTCLIMLQSPSPVDRVGPMTLSTRFPGYEPTDFDVYARILDEDFVGDTLFLEPQSELLGAVQLEPVHSPDSFARADRELLAGELRFQDTHGGDFRIAITFGDLADRLVLEGLPQGEFEVRFVSNKGYFRLPASRGRATGASMQLRIGEETAALELDFSGAATVELELLDFKGWPALDRAGFVPMQRGSNGRWSSRGTVGTRWSSPGERPVVMFGPGTYRIGSMGAVVGLAPKSSAEPRGSLDPPLLLKLRAGDVIKLVWQKVSG